MGSACGGRDLSRDASVLWALSGELTPCFAANLNRLSGSCGYWLAPVHSLVATVVAIKLWGCRPQPCLTLYLLHSSQPWQRQAHEHTHFWGLGPQPPYPTHDSHEGRVLWSAWAWSYSVHTTMTSCLSGRPRLSPGLFLLCCTHSHQSIFTAVNLSPTSQAWDSAPSPYSPQMADKLLLIWEVLVSNYLCGEFSPFCLWAPVVAFPSEVPKVLHVPAHEKVSNFSFFTAPSERWRACLALSLYFLVAFPYCFM